MKRRNKHRRGGGTAPFDMRKVTSESGAPLQSVFADLTIILASEPWRCTTMKTKTDDKDHLENFALQITAASRGYGALSRPRPSLQVLVEDVEHARATLAAALYPGVPHVSWPSLEDLASEACDRIRAEKY